MAENKSQDNTLHQSFGHTAKRSLDTNASGLAESAISYSAFPEPPSSIPVTPVRSVFGPPSPGLGTPLIPAHPRYGSPHEIRKSIAPSSRFPPSTSDQESARLFSSQRGKQGSDVNSVSTGSISPYDWHEGASSIDVDAAEDRLLPTSFITSLLQENVNQRGADRTSRSSDAISGISEMTYPPRNPYTDFLRDSSTTLQRSPSYRQSYKGALPRPVGGRAPSSFHLHKNHKHRGNFQNQGPVQPTVSRLPAARLEGHGHHQTTVITDSVLSQSTLIAEQPGSYGHLSGRLPVYSEVDESDNSAPRSPSTLVTPPADLPRVQHNLRRRESTHSTRSAAPSFISRISSLHSIRRALTWRRKPLPPIPTIPHISLAMEREHRKVEEQAPLPDLVNRANELHGLLEKGYHPHQSILSYPTKSEQFSSSFDESTSINRHRENNTQHSSLSLFSRGVACVKHNKLWVIIGIFATIAVIIIAIAVGVTRKKHKNDGLVCPQNMGGANCHLNATCVCLTATSPCNVLLAQTILDLIPVMNDRQSVNLTASTVYHSFWMIHGQFQDSSCLQQVDLIDVSPALDGQRDPNRTQWAQTALLWTLTQTQNSTPIGLLQDFIRKADWAKLGSSDGPVTSVASTFTTSAAGYSYDFAAQKIVPLPATFVGEGQPQGEQKSRVDNDVLPSLNRMYGYAVASSKQQETALSRFWTGTLLQQEDRLEPFKAAFAGSPMILPLDATAQPIHNLYSSNSLPPPPACYPGLGQNQQALISAVEGKAFGLTPPVSAANQLNATCFAGHPTYGVLDVLRLHLPFLDSRTNVAKQGIILAPNTAPRAILAVGEALSALPGSVNATRNMAALVDSRNYGTTAYANHIILQYLSSVSTTTANAIVNHVLDRSHLPPSLATESSLFPLESIPVLEVAVFGNIEAADATAYISSFTTPAESLFFGSAVGSDFRTWVFGRGGTIAWSENATTPETVHDKSSGDVIFNQTWAAAATAINTHAPNVGLVNVTDSFRSNNRFSLNWPLDI